MNQDKEFQYWQEQKQKEQDMLANELSKHQKASELAQLKAEVRKMRNDRLKLKLGLPKKDAVIKAGQTTGKMAGGLFKGLMAIGGGVNDYYAPKRKSRKSKRQRG